MPQDDPLSARSETNARSTTRPGTSPWGDFPDDVTLTGADGAEPPAVIATAIHDGHRLPEDIARRMRLAAADRRREEDPYTADLIAGTPARLVVHRSRFAGDLNRPTVAALYRGPEDAWGLDLWHTPPDDAGVQAVQAWHAGFYQALGRLLDTVAARRPGFVVLDVHSYNHRRDGPEAPGTPGHRAPDINIGTASLKSGRADALIATVHDRVRATTLPDGRTPTIANDVAFQGRGELTRFVNGRYPEQGCALAIEVRKFFMDEWTGQPDPATIAVLRTMFAALADDLARLLPR